MKKGETIIEVWNTISFLVIILGTVCGHVFNWDIDDNVYCYLYIPVCLFFFLSGFAICWIFKVKVLSELCITSIFFFLYFVYMMLKLNYY